MTSIHRVQTTEVLATTHSMHVVIVSKDEMDALFISTMVRCNDKEVRYLGIAVDKRRLDQIKKGELTLREAFLSRQGCWIDGYAKSPIPNNFDSKVRSGAVPDAYLPPDMRLRPGPELDIALSLGR